MPRGSDIDGRYFPFPNGSLPVAIWRCKDPECGLITLEEYLATAPGPRFCPQHRRSNEPGGVMMERLEVFVSPSQEVTEWMEGMLKAAVKSFLGSVKLGLSSFEDVAEECEELRVLCRIFRLQFHMVAREVGAGSELRRLAQILSDWDRY